MTKDEIKIGETYLFKHSSGIIRVKVLNIDTIPGHRFWPGSMVRSHTRWTLRNLRTGREIVAKSAQKFRPLPDGATE